MQIAKFGPSRFAQIFAHLACKITPLLHSGRYEIAHCVNLLTIPILKNTTHRLAPFSQLGHYSLSGRFCAS